MKKVILSQRAYLSMLAEVYERVKTETGGIFLGHRDGDTWYVLESVEPGPKSIFTPTYFEYDDAYVTYRANKIRRLYKCSIELLGLWHRHPSLMKVFSSTDDVTNKKYSDLLSGAISGIVTLGNGFEITMYYVPSNIQYEKIECVVDDEQIPKNYIAYYDTEYYKQLVNDIAVKTYGHKYRLNEDPNTVQQSDFKEDGKENRNESVEQSNVSLVSPHKKDGISKLIAKAGDLISHVLSFEDDEDDAVQSVNRNDNGEIDDRENDIAYIYDIIEPEIEYLQRLDKDGKIQATIAGRKDQNGMDLLTLSITDLRQIEKYTYRLVFFVNNDKVWVTDEEGNTRLYTENTIYTILGGKS